MSELDLETRTVRKVIKRFSLLFMVCFFVAFLDRVNVGFAALTMNRDIGLSASTFGLGAGLFFVTYFLFEVPSNMIMERVGARRWIARIMLSWGIVSACTALVVGPNSFYAIRLLLGIAEAGFNPAVLFFFTLWVPAKYRAGVLATFLSAMPIASVIGSPLASLLLGMEGVGGLHGWQWMFIIDALPAILLVPLVLKVLSDRPRDAQWLTAEERGWLERTLAAERAAALISSDGGILKFLFSPRILLLCFAYFGLVGFNYGLSFFLPQILHQFGLSIFQTGMVNAIPFALALVGMNLWGASSDRHRERRFHTIAPVALAAVTLAASTLGFPPVGQFVLLCVAVVATFSAIGVFFASVLDLLGAGSAPAIAMVNCCGNLSGFVYVYVMGIIKDATGGFAGGLQLIALVGVATVVIVWTQSAKASARHVPA